MVVSLGLEGRYWSQGSAFTHSHAVLGLGATLAFLASFEIVPWLKDPGRYTRMGVNLPRGALLSGPPGTGKTLLARAVAGEAEVAFFCAIGSDFDNRYGGTGSDSVRRLFGQARQHQPAIVFIEAELLERESLDEQALAAIRACSG